MDEQSTPQQQNNSPFNFEQFRRNSFMGQVAEPGGAELETWKRNFSSWVGELEKLPPDERALALAPLARLLDPAILSAREEREEREKEERLKKVLECMEGLRDALENSEWREIGLGLENSNYREILKYDELLGKVWAAYEAHEFGRPLQPCFKEVERYNYLRLMAHAKLRERGYY